MILTAIAPLNHTYRPSSSAFLHAGSSCELKPQMGSSDGVNPPSKDTPKRSKVPLSTSPPGSSTGMQMA